MVKLGLKKHNDIHVYENSINIYEQNTKYELTVTGYKAMIYYEVYQEMLRIQSKHLYIFANIG